MIPRDTGRMDKAFGREGIPESYRIDRAGVGWGVSTRDAPDAEWIPWEGRVFSRRRDAISFGEWFLDIAEARRKATEDGGA